MNDERKILLIANADNRLFEINSGAALRNNLFLRTLSEIGHVDIICFAEDNVISNIPNCDVIYSIQKFDSRGIWGAIHSLLCMTVRPSSPYSYFRLDKHKNAIINNFIRRTDYDIIACRYVETAIICGLLKYKDKLVIDLDDNLSSVRKYEAIRSHSIIRKWKKYYESRRIVKMLSRICDDVRCSFCSNPKELPSPRTIFLHNTTVLDQLGTDYSYPLSPRILYVGYLDYYPNRHGIIHFVKSVFPLIRSAIPLAELRVVGEGAKEVVDYLNSIEGVKAVGRVDNLVAEYQEAAAVVIPVYYGSGTSVKFVEALFMNRPVISTFVGTRGFSDVCQEGKDYMLAKDDEEFAAKTIELLSSEHKSKEMANNGRLIANKWFSQNKFKEIVKRSVGGL